MGTLSSLPTNSNPSLADFLIAIQASSTTDKKLTIQSLLPIIFGGQLQTYTPSYGNLTNCTVQTTSGWYINLGGIKIAWGNIGYSFTGGNSTCYIQTISQPPSFFSSIQIGFPGINSEGGTAYQHAEFDGGGKTASFSLYADGGNGLGTGAIASWIFIGA